MMMMMMMMTSYRMTWSLQRRCLETATSSFFLRQWCGVYTSNAATGSTTNAAAAAAVKWWCAAARSIAVIVISISSTKSPRELSGNRFLSTCAQWRLPGEKTVNAFRLSDSRRSRCHVVTPVRLLVMVMVMVNVCEWSAERTTLYAVIHTSCVFLISYSSLSVKLAGLFLHVFLCKTHFSNTNNIFLHLTLLTVQHRPIHCTTSCEI